MSTKRPHWIFIAFLLFLPASLSRAEAITVPMDPWPPWKFVDIETWEVDRAGIDVRLLETLISSYNKTFGANIKIDYKGYPWKRCLEMIRQGKADLVSGVLKRPEREEYMVFIEPPYKTRSSKVFYVRKGMGNLIQKYGDLHDLRIGVQAGVSYFERFDNDPNIQKEEAGDDISNFKKLEHGRIDAVISTETQADYLIATSGFKGKFEKAVFKYDYSLPVYFALSKQSPLAEKAPQFSAIVEKLADQGVFETIIKAYFENLNTEKH